MHQVVQMVLEVPMVLAVLFLLVIPLSQWFLVTPVVQLRPHHLVALQDQLVLVLPTSSKRWFHGDVIITPHPLTMVCHILKT